MANITDLASIAAATAAGYTRTQYTTVDAGGATHFITRLEKALTGESGTTGTYKWTAVGDSTSAATTADAKALTALNAQRQHRYAGAPGRTSGQAGVGTFPDGLATVPTVDVT